MKIGSSRYERIFPTNQRGKFSRLVVGVRCIGNQFPGIYLSRGLPRNQPTDSVFLPALHRFDRIVGRLGENGRKELSPRLLINCITDQVLDKAGPELLFPCEALGNNRIEVQASNDSQILGVVRYHKKIQWRTDLHARLVPGVHYRHTLRIAVGSVGRGSQITVGESVR